MSLFSKTVDKRNKIINKYAKRFAKEIKWKIYKTSRSGEFVTQVNLQQAYIYDAPGGLIREIYDRTVDILNEHYKGEVEVKILFYKHGPYRSIEATIIKV